MVINREKFDELLAEYDYNDYDAERACDFVKDLLNAEREHLEEHEPTAWRSIEELGIAAHQASTMGSDISADCFDEE